jgi:hypothetical protein
MLIQLPRIVFAALFFCVFAVAHAEEPGKVNLEAAEMVAELIGAPVFASDGAEVGTVADISFDDDGQPNRLRMTTVRALGLGTRTIEIPKRSFMPLRGAVVLDLPAEAVSTFAELAEPAEQK